jgi:hypothetical protein
MATSSRHGNPLAGEIKWQAARLSYFTLIFEISSVVNEKLSQLFLY